MEQLSYKVDGVRQDLREEIGVFKQMVVAGILEKIEKRLAETETEEKGTGRRRRLG